MMHITTTPIAALPKLDTAGVFNAISTRIHAMIGIVFAANEAARLAEARKPIDMEQLERLGLFGNPDA